MTTTNRAAVARRGRLFQYLTILWNSAECLVALVAGFVAGSIALVGFGFDSAIEVTSSLAALWRLRSDADKEGRELAEKRTLRIIGACFMLLAPYVLYDAAHTLLTREPPSVSVPGIVITALSLIVMPALVHASAAWRPRSAAGRWRPDARVRVSVGDRPGWAGPECSVRLVVG